MAYAARRDAFVDAAIRLIQRKGYDQLSIQDVIEEVGASKGAFFHYFDSRTALLAAVVDRMVADATVVVAPIVDDPQLNAVEKLQRLFAGIGEWKSAQPELRPAAVAQLMETWFSEENTIVLARLRAAVGTRLTPLITEILRQGAVEGSFRLVSPEGTASVVTALILGMNEELSRLFLARRKDAVSFELVMCTVSAYAEAFERLLGIPATSLPIADESALRFWFD